MAAVWWLLIGVTVGSLAHRLTPGRPLGGLAGSLVAGTLGAVLSALLLAVTRGAGLTGAGAAEAVVAAVGALTVVALFRLACGTSGRREPPRVESR